MIRNGERREAGHAGRAARLPAQAWPLVALAGAAGGFLLSLTAEPAYIADARVIVGTAGLSSAGADLHSSGVIDGEVAVLNSRELASQVIKRHDLASRLDRGTRPSLFDTVLVAVGLLTNPSHSSIEDRALATFEDGLSVAPVGSSRVIDISYAASDPGFAATVANAVADTYVKDLTIVSERSGQASLQWLQGEIESLRARVNEADSRIERYRSGSDVFDIVSGGQRTDLASQELSELNAELVRARAAHAEANARAEVVRQILKQGSAVEAAREVLDSALIQRLREQQVRLQSEKAELSSTYLPGHPKIESLQSQLNDLDGQIRAEIRKVLKSVEMAADISAARVSSLQDSLSELKSNALSRGTVVELRALEQDARAQRELLETFLTRYRLLAAETGGARPGARIISKARPPTAPARPVRTVWAAVGAGISLVFVLFSALAGRADGSVRGRFVHQEEEDDLAEIIRAARRQARRESFRETILPSPADDARPRHDTAWRDVAARTPDAGTGNPVENTPEAVPCVAPQEKREPAPQVPEPAVARKAPDIDDAPGTAELGRILTENRARIVLFAGAGPARERESATDRLALAAAARAAAAGCAAVLLDIGLRPSPVLTPHVGEPGLGHLISGRAPFGRVIRRDAERGVDVIGMGRAMGNPPLKRLATAVAKLARRYDKVILVADRVEDWPHLFVRPDFAVLVCDPAMDDARRRALYDSVRKRGAKQALIVRNEWQAAREARRAA
ncbi:MAG TPA: exopolysaccharide transport family protein [Afifellaceae bacterium]|nr:exopolysaccharide transport family protein [Afifellaceae bacterium]